MWDPEVLCNCANAGQQCGQYIGAIIPLESRPLGFQRVLSSDFQLLLSLMDSGSSGTVLHDPRRGYLCVCVCVCVCVVGWLDSAQQAKDTGSVVDEFAMPGGRCGC